MAGRRYRLSPLSIRETSTTYSAPITSATVTVYLAGTSTLATCYADTTTATALAGSQTTTNASGYFEFFVDAKDYRPTQKFKITIAKTGYTTITYDYLDPIQNKSKTIDVLDFGVLGDGATDNTTLLQSAINTAATADANLYIPSGHYKFTKLYFYYDASLNPGWPSAAAQKGKIRIYGDRSHFTQQLEAGNNYGTILESTDATGPGISAVDANYVTTSFYLENMSVVATNTTRVALFDHINYNCNLMNVAFLQKGAGDGVLVESTWVNNWKNVDIRKLNAALTGIGLVVRTSSGETGGGNTMFENVSVSGFDKNWEVGHSTANGGGTLNSVACRGCQSSASKTYGILLGHGLAGFSWQTSYVEAGQDAGAGIGIWIKNKAADIRINGASWFSGNDTDIMLGDGTDGTTTDVFRNVIIEGNAFSVRGTGIKVYSTASSFGARIAHNRFDENASPIGATIGIDLEDVVHHGLEVEGNQFGMLAALDTNINNASRINTYKAVTATGEVSIIKDGYIGTLADSATPSILSGRYWITGGTTTITNFTNGITGQVITILSEHAITITDGTNIFLSGSVNFVMASSDTLTLIQKADGKWYEISRSDNT